MNKICCKEEQQDLIKKKETRVGGRCTVRHKWTKKEFKKGERRARMNSKGKNKKRTAEYQGMK